MYKGQFKFKNGNGVPLTYKSGDLVLNQGQMFVCTQTTQKSPQQDRKKWQATGLTEPFQGAIAPINPREGQLWMNTDGKMYIWYKDNDSFQWIEI
jgi:hypothetical protein